jgi:hypothetical protein
MMSLPKEQLLREAEKLGPWWFQFEYEGYRFGGKVPRDTRKTELFFEWAEKLKIPVRTILELGSHEGSHSLQLAAHPSVQRVIGLEGRQDNLARANFVKRVFGCNKCEFREMDLEKWHPASEEEYDAIFCAGVLYHVTRPWNLIDRIAECRPKLLFIDTHYATSEAVLVERWTGMWHQEGSDPLSGLSSRSFWMSFKDLVMYVMEKGFLVRFAQDMEDYPKGPRVWLLCERSEAVGSVW